MRLGWYSCYPIHVTHLSGTWIRRIIIGKSLSFFFNNFISCGGGEYETNNTFSSLNKGNWFIKRTLIFQICILWFKKYEIVWSKFLDQDLLAKAETEWNDEDVKGDVWSSAISVDRYLYLPFFVWNICRRLGLSMLKASVFSDFLTHPPSQGSCWRG